MAPPKFRGYGLTGWVGPRKYEKITEKIQKWRENYHFCIFSDLRGPTQDGGFCNFFVFFFRISGLGGVSVPCTSPTELQGEAQKSPLFWCFSFFFIVSGAPAL